MLAISVREALRAAVQAFGGSELLPSPLTPEALKSMKTVLLRSEASGVTKKVRMTMEKIPMTAQGYASLETELKRRTSEDRPKIIQDIAEARAHGDLSENAEYHAAKEAQSHNEGRIGELEDMLSRAEVIDVKKLSGSTVKFGAFVTLVDEDTDQEKKYQIVGDVEADVKAGRISISSPIARALIGKTVGDSVEVTAPGGARAYEITEVQFG